MYDQLDERPPDFEIDYDHFLARGAVLLDLGQHPKTNRYTDSSHFQNTGALTGMSPVDDWIWSSELGRWVLDFDGTDYVTGAGTAFADVFTISLWINNRTTDYSSNAYLVSEYETGTSKRMWAVVINSTTETISAATGNGGTGAVVNGTVDIVENAWRHIVIAFQGAAQKADIYVNGIWREQLSMTYAFSPLSSPLTIGALPGGGNAANAQFSDMCKHNRHLSAAEICILANRSDPMLGGLILPPRRKLWAVSGGAPPTSSSRRRRLLCTGN